MQEGEKVVISEQDFRRRFVYDHTNLLGEGGFAKVYQAYDRQFEETVALKFYTNTDAQKYDIISEMRNSRRFTHKNIIRVHDARIVRFTNSFGIAEDVQVGILEYANAGNLLDFLKSSPSKEVFKEVIKEILQGLHYIHTEKRVIHRDLSPDNILMVKEKETWIPKIADFGISKEIDMKTLNMGQKKASSELVGKMEYMAPEQFDPKKYGINQQITTNVDLWSFGVILTEIFTDKSPFGDRNTSQSPMEIMHNVLHNPLPSEIKNVPEPYRKIISKCLIKDAKKRVQSSLELIEILQAPVPTKKKMNKAMIAGILLVFVLLAFGFWYVFTSSDAPAVKNEETAQIQSQKSESVPAQLMDSTSAGTDSSRLTQETMPPIKASGQNVIEADTILTEDSTLANQPKSLPLPLGLTNAQKNMLYDNLLREIESLDNEIINTNLRLSRINNYVNEYFVDEEAKVYFTVNDSINQESIESFMRYVVNTSGIEERSWVIDTLLTELKGDKIKTLSINKY
ncbi:serine/threonine protein kinase [Catalinimonas alkaloidigena]|uniref:serine/threonine-protein kinase n=1 Tax=Catalinimonas alkaloidigena TaxID=1075417 RepID=UPI0024066D34|nr:serine/threonine-protein kinase [Catalinimonas alkaloidigena]MDF9798773.1 serine/threonine protein kinase [Catalinimonas alkaloidigena]